MYMRVGQTWVFEDYIRESGSGNNAAIISCSEGDMFEITPSGGIVPYCFVNDDNVILDFEPDNYNIGVVTKITAPPGSARVLIQSKNKAYYIY